MALSCDGGGGLGEVALSCDGGEVAVWCLVFLALICTTSYR